MSATAAGAAADRFRALTGTDPEGIWQAPGRVNLIGEHTDYNDGWALPFAIDRHVTVALRRRDDRRVRCLSTVEPAVAEADLDALRPADLAPWARYPLGVVWALQKGGQPLSGVDLVLDSTVPIGAGLSSSAALQAAVAVALNDVCRLELDRDQLARACHRAETDFVGAPVGLLDQLAVLHGRAGCGLLIDFRSRAVEAIPLTIGPLVVVDTGVRHRNAAGGNAASGTAAGGYAARRESCRQAAARLDVPSLRDADVSMVAGLPGDLGRRARHVVSENDRVLKVARLLQAGGPAAKVGPLLLASHASLRDDYEVSCPELDAVVATARATGASGARLTGAGFGGSAIVLGLDAETLIAALQLDGQNPHAVFAVVPSDGAGRTD